MLVLLLLLGLTVAILVIREAWSDTYRCPRCAQLSVGRYHRLRCLAVARKEDSRVQHPSKAPRDRRHGLASQGGLLALNLGTARNHRTNRMLAYIPGLLQPSVTARNASSAAGRRIHAGF
jgi:hypothetical protein